MRGDSDGVTAEPLVDINPGPAGSLGSFVTNAFRKVGGQVLFGAYDEAHGLELWAADGASSTRLVQDVAAGAGWSSPRFLTPVGPLVFFTANDNVAGNELWAISKSGLTGESNRAAYSPELAPQDDDEPTPGRGGSADEFRAFVPSLEEDPPELAASAAEAP